MRGDDFNFTKGDFFVRENGETKIIQAGSRDLVIEADVRLGSNGIDRRPRFKIPWTEVIVWRDLFTQALEDSGQADRALDQDIERLQRIKAAREAARHGNGSNNGTDAQKTKTKAVR